MGQLLPASGRDSNGVNRKGLDWPREVCWGPSHKRKKRERTCVHSRLRANPKTRKGACQMKVDKISVIVARGLFMCCYEHRIFGNRGELGSPREAATRRLCAAERGLARS